jgi:GDPmannose 4,6-dehydratase
MNVTFKLDRSRRTVMVTGVTGQDGSLMADYLLAHTPYNVVGGARHPNAHNHENIRHLIGNPRFHLINNLDLMNSHFIFKMIFFIRPDFFINLAAQTSVQSSWECPVLTWDTNTTGVIHILEALRQHCPGCRFFNAGSSEEFGEVRYSPQDEKHRLRPQSPYGASKAAARQIVSVYRDSYKLFAIQSWMFNHEGTRRGAEFVTRKITKKVVEIYNNIKSPTNRVIPLYLGNLDVKRDWLDAEDCVEAIWLMLNNSEPKEYVVGSGESHSIREFVEVAFDHVGIHGNWNGKGVDEYLWYNDGPKPLASDECQLVKIDPDYYRPAEAEYLCGNSTKIRAELGWKPKTSFKQLVTKMVDHDQALSSEYK